MGDVKRVGAAPIFAGLLGLAGGGALIIFPWLNADRANEPLGLCFSTPMQFKSHVVSGCLTHADIEQLSSEPLSFDQNNDKGVTLTDPANVNAQRVVTNCRDYDKAAKVGWYALSTYDQSMESYFKRACGVLSLMTSGAKPARSYLDTGKEGFGSADKISAEAIGGLVPEGRGLTVGDLVRSGTVTILAEEPHRMVVSANGMKGDLTELARGDFDGDGTADILAFLTVHAENGSFRSYQVEVLTRKAANRPLDVSRSLASSKP